MRTRRFIEGKQDVLTCDYRLLLIEKKRKTEMHRKSQKSTPTNLKNRVCGSFLAVFTTIFGYSCVGGLSEVSEG